MLFVVLLLAQPCIAQVRNSSQQPRPSGEVTAIQPIDCNQLQAASAGTKTFQDELTGFRFEYAAYLTLDESDLSLADRPCGNPPNSHFLIQIEVSLPVHYREPFYSSQVTVSTTSEHGIEWKQYAAPSEVRMCTFAMGEQVCIFAETPPEHRVPDAASEAMKQIEATFAFTDPSKRMDARIASMKVGERYRGLKVRRVVTREMARRDPKKYPLAAGYGGFGEIDFAGALTLRASIEDIGTALSPGQFRASPDSEGGPQLPFDLDRNLGSGIVLYYPPTLENKLREADPNGDFIIVLKNIRAAFGPLGGESLVEADLVSVTSASPLLTPK
jgi:hypothetical protein